MIVPAPIDIGMVNTPHRKRWGFYRIKAGRQLFHGRVYSKQHCDRGQERNRKDSDGYDQTDFWGQPDHKQNILE